MADIDKEIIKDKDDKVKWEEKMILYEKLSVIFGTKGIQHFLYMDVVDQLQTVANSYLDVMTSGGISLELKGNIDEEKVVKNVLIRSKNGDKLSRELSQLSGGQWRRVSLALDLAYANLIHRKGHLRSNIMIMDEVLTHLDASGRESVGKLLRALVGKNLESDNEENLLTNENTSMRSLTKEKLFDTILVVLQDLASMELEEYFDHIDVVQKTGDSSIVLVDEDEDGRI